MKRLVEKKAIALEMREQGMSYSQIKDKLNVSKSSLSLWLRDHPLADERIRELRGLSVQRIEKYRNTRAQTKKFRLEQIQAAVDNELRPFSQRELYIAGLALYWGEGSKTQPGTVCLSNTDPDMVKFFLFWLTEVIAYPKNKIKIKLHLYKDMDPEEATSFWSDQLDIEPKYFSRPYVKTSTLAGLTYKGYGHGTCNVIIYNTNLHLQILAGMKSISGLRTTEIQRRK